MSPALALRLWRVAAAVVTAAVLLLLVLPGDHLPVHPLTGLDKLAHLASYLLIGLTWHRAGVRPAWILGLGLLLALGTEAAQGTLARGREPEVLDAAANVAGLVLGTGASWLAARNREGNGRR